MSARKRTEIESFVISKVKEMREDKHISQSELATLIGVSDGFIGQVESPHFSVKYNLNHINRLAIVFECSVKDFMPDKPFKG